MTRKINRRRFMRIAAATASFGAARLLTSPSFAAADPAPTIWRGLALGNLASIEILHPDSARAAALLETARVEIERLESILSLYRPDSALSVLNRGGILRDPPLDLVRVLGEARRFGEITAGAFDVTVQPLWKVYADHFSLANCDPAGPSPASVRRAAARVDYRALEIEPEAVGLRRPEMAVTLNGIAQGYITDRIAELLRNEGLDHVLVDLGEIRAVGRRTPTEPWRIGIETPDRADSFLTEVSLQDMALATSGSYGFRFDATGNFHHIFDPKSGICPHRYASVSVLAPDATTADALATACNLLAPEAISAALKAAGARRVLVVETGGETGGAMRWIDA